MTFDDFIEMLDRVGHGKEARIRMTINDGMHRYEREPGQVVWLPRPNQ